MAVHWCPGKGKCHTALVFFTARLIVSICLAGHLHAQQPVVRAYSLNTADEDWSFLSDRSKRSDFWDPLKYISLGGEGRYLTLSSEIRYRKACGNACVRGSPACLGVERVMLCRVST